MILVCSYVTWPVLHFVNQEVPEHGEGDFLEGQGREKVMERIKNPQCLQRIGEHLDANC